jgi:predicted GNAT family acetyltransferase
MTDVPAELRDNAAAGQFELAVDGTAAILEYRRRKGRLLLIHTEVPEALRGRGLASALIKQVLDLARAEGIQVIAVCPTVQEYIRKHPEYMDLLARPLPKPAADGG